MKITWMSTAICRTPAFSPDEDPEKAWPALKDMIREASPEFYQHIAELDYKEISTAGEKLQLTCWKYFNRAKYRATPFGLFATISFIPVTNSPGQIILDNQVIKHCFNDWRAKDEELFSAMPDCFLANATWYPASDELRYIRFTGEHFELTVTPRLPVLETILGLCHQPTTIQKIRSLLCISYGMSTKAINGLLRQLLSNQLLLSNHSPNITGMDYFERLNIKKIANHYLIAERPVADGALDPAPFQYMPAYFNFIKDFIPQKDSLDMDTFRRRFSRKFEQKAIPLSLVMDPETGVGYGDLGDEPGDELSDQLLLSGQTGQAIHQTFNFSSQTQFLLNALINGGPIRLESYQDKGPDSPQLPNTLSIICSLCDGVPVMESIGGATANSLLGRFTLPGGKAHTLAQEISKIEEEANPGILFFDVAYQAEKKVDNVNRRQQLYEAELPILCWSLHQQPLALSDLLVLVRNQEVILWSKTYNRRAVPRIASAYNYTRSDLAVYRFLCDLQHQGLSTDLTFRFQRLLPGLMHYPRVLYKNIIVSPAMWKLPIAGNELKTWLTEKGIDFPFKCGNGDQMLRFDPTHGADIDAFIAWHRGQNAPENYIAESFDSDLVSDRDGKRRGAQYIINWSHTEQVYPIYSAPVVVPDQAAVFHPGSEWLYLELYTHPLRANQLLQVLKQFAGQHGGVIKKWFFIRYDDPAPHIRFRLQLRHVHDTGLLLSTLKTVLQPFTREGLISDIQVKSYFPEYTRYGAANMHRVEYFFYLDSLRVSSLLAHKPDTGGITRQAVSTLLVLLSLAIPGNELALVKKLAANFATEFAISGNGFKQLNQSFERLGLRNLEPIVLSKLYRKAYLTALIDAKTDEQRQQLCADLLHMHINRTFHTKQRLHEAIIYQYLLKLLMMRHARRDAQSAPLAIN